MMDYDTIAVRIHPGGNTATKSSYYTGSAVENWYNIIGIKVKYYQQFIQLRNRSTYKMLIREIKSMIKINPECVKEPKFWIYALTALIVPGFILRPLSKFIRANAPLSMDDVKRREHDKAK